MSVQKDLGEHKYWPFRSLKNKKEDEAAHLPNPVVDGELIPNHCILSMQRAAGVHFNHNCL